ncbi:MAG: hypothetical protein QXQ90_09035 [Desulfurococcaceae archaeon]
MVKSILTALISVALLLLVAGAPALVHLPEELAELGACINRGELLEPACVHRASLMTCIAVALALMLTAFDIIRKPREYSK